eukprot:gene35659-47944_t
MNSIESLLELELSLKRKPKTLTYESNESDRLLHSSFGGRLFTCIPLDQLTVGMTVLVFGFSSPDAPADSVAGLVAGYVVVNRLPDGSCDAVCAYIVDGTMAIVHPRVLTFFPCSELKSVPILSDSAISTHSFPASIATFARAQNMKMMIGVPVLSTASALPAPTSGREDPSKVLICGAMNKTALWPAVQTSRSANLEFGQRDECVRAVTKHLGGYIQEQKRVRIADRGTR